MLNPHCLLCLVLHLIQIILPFSKTRSKRFAKNEMGWMSLVVNILSGHVSSSLLSLKCEITPILLIFLFTFFFYIVTSQFKGLAITLLSSCVSMSSTPKNFRDLSISLRNILYHRRVQHTVSDPIPDQFCIFC